MQHHCHRLRSILGLPSLSTKPPRRHSSSQADECLSDIITEFEEQVEESLEGAIDAAVRAPFSRQIFKVWCVGKEGILKAPIPSDDLVYRESLKTTLGENGYSGGLWIHLEPLAFQGWR